MRALIADHDPARFKGIADGCIARGHLVERATQGAAGGVHPRVHGAQRDAERARDRGAAHALDLEHHEHRALLGLEARQQALAPLAIPAHGEVPEPHALERAPGDRLVLGPGGEPSLAQLQAQALPAKRLGGEGDEQAGEREQRQPHAGGQLGQRQGRSHDREPETRAHVVGHQGSRRVA